MDKKSQVREYIKKHRYFSLDGVVQSTGLGRSVAVKYLQFFKTERIVFSAGRGLYTSVAREFIHQKVSRVEKIRQLIIKEYPGLNFLAWNTIYFQPYYHHQQTHNLTVVEVEYDGVKPVADMISRFYRSVSVESRGKGCPPGFDITKDPIIVRSLISRSPREGHQPRLEKMLVDLYMLKNKYKTMSDADYWELWSSIFSLYRIDFSKIVDYAVRRRNARMLCSQLIYSAGLKEVVYGNKTTILPKMTCNKKEVK